MKPLWKRMIAAGCAVTLTMGCSACGGKTDSSESSTEGGKDEIAEVSVMFGTVYNTDGTQEVQDAVNKITEEKYGIHFNISLVDFGNLAQQTNLLLTGNDVDILQVNNLQNYVNNGQVENLQPYWDNASPEMKNLIDEEWIEACKVKGDLYGLPKLVDFGHINGLCIDEEVATEYGFTDMQNVTMEEIDAFLAWAKETYPERYPLAPFGTQILADTDWSWDTLGDNIGVLPDRGQSSTTVESLMDNKDYIELAKWCRKWYQAGYVTPDILSNTEDGGVMIKNKEAVSKFAGYGPAAQKDIIRTVVVDHWTNSGNIAVSTYVVNANSKNKEAAWKAMEILYTDPEVGTYIYNGIEGRDYVMNEDGTMSYPDGLDASTVPYGQSGITWIMPWVGNGGIPHENDGADYFDKLLQYNKEGLFSVANGFKFDASPVVDEYTACNNVLQKYYKTLLSGAVDVDSTLEQARQEFKDAGLDKVIAEKQKQLDAYLAEKEAE